MSGRSSKTSESGDRKSTRLNSSHVKNSYAVFCLKKKKKQCDALGAGEKREIRKAKKHFGALCVDRIHALAISRLVFPIEVGIFFFFNDTATTEIYTLSLHDALPI